MQVVSVSVRRSLIGGVDDGKVVGPCGWEFEVRGVGLVLLLACGGAFFGFSACVVLFCLWVCGGAFP